MKTSAGREGRGIAVLCVVIAVSTAITAGIGVFARGGRETELVVSPRGEEYVMVTEGIYRYNPQRLVAEGVGWDVFTLFVALPLFLFVLPGLRKGRLRSQLPAIGILAYLFYQYLMYAVTWAFGPLFLPFVAIYALSMMAILWIVSTIDVRALPDRFGAGFPHRGMGLFSIIMGTILVLMWMGRIVPALSGEIGGILLGQTTLVVQALDLGIVVPLVLFTGVTILRRRAVGYLLAPVFAVKGAAMAGAICAMLLSAWVTEGNLEIAPLVLFAGAFLAAVWLGARVYRSIA